MTTAETITRPSAPQTSDAAIGSLFYIGTGTMILNYGGITILTDPNFLHQGQQVHLGYGILSTRQTEPAIRIESLPPIDLVLLSHMHGDHFDRVAEEHLSRNLPIVTTPHGAAILKRKGFMATQPLETWESFEFSKGDSRLTITSMPGVHARGIFGKLLPPVMGSMLDLKDAGGKHRYRLYISGDTVMYDGLNEIPRRYQDIDLAILHLGWTRVLGVTLTMNEQEGIELLKLVQPQLAIPIHFNDYTVFKSPLENFKQAVRATGLENRIRYVGHGDTYVFENMR